MASDTAAASFRCFHITIAGYAIIYADCRSRQAEGYTPESFSSPHFTFSPAASFHFALQFSPPH
jgi:hypothetical protein